jgi:DNA replication protein DnaC
MRFLGGVEMFLELKKTFNSHGGLNESDVLDSILDSDIFFLDDLDKLIRWSPYERERATLIFDSCYNQMKTVIITSNKSLQELLINNQLESHLHSRLTEMCKVIEIKDKPDYRLKTNGLQIKRSFV